MNSRFKRLFILSNFLLALTVAFLTACSSPNDNASAARQVSEAWVAENIDQVSDKLAEVIGKDYSSFTKPILATLLKNGMTWEYSTQKIGRDNWQVTVHASNSINLSKVGISKIASASGEIMLSVDTANLRVKSYNVRSDRFNARLADIPK